MAAVNLTRTSCSLKFASLPRCQCTQAGCYDDHSIWVPNSAFKFGECKLGINIRFYSTWQVGLVYNQSICITESLLHSGWQALQPWLRLERTWMSRHEKWMQAAEGISFHIRHGLGDHDSMEEATFITAFCLPRISLQVTEDRDGLVRVTGMVITVSHSWFKFNTMTPRPAQISCQCCLLINRDKIESVI